MENRIIKTLLDRSVITQAQAQALRDEGEKNNIAEEDLLVKEGLLSEKDLAILKGELFGLPFVDLEKKEIDHEVLMLIPQAVAETHELVVFEKKEKEVHVALVNPGNFRAIEVIDFWAKKEGYTVVFYITTQNGYHTAVRSYVTFTKEVSEALEVLEKREAKDRAARKPAHLVEIIRKAPVSKIVSLLVQEAVDARTSDIHIEPGTDETRVRFRIDGMLRTFLTLPAYHHSALIARIKVLASLKIDETRIPQDGRIRISVYGEDINLRVSTLPVLGNEKVVMRILPTATKIITLEDLGFWDGPLEVLEKILERPSGVLLVSGPTGSGKSTTLYSLLTSLNKEGANITTLEDPVEYFLNGINQVQINPEVGLTFASGLRAILRQDPNIIMVGEIRDMETAELATHAALTGHFMLSTIHAKGVLGVIPRLVDMHVEPFLIAAALNTITAQRLVRKICQKCKIAADIPEGLVKEFYKEIKDIPSQELLKSLPLEKDFAFFKGKGCDECGMSGYHGRTVVSEILMMTEELGEIMNGKFSFDDLGKEMVRQGQMSYKQDAIVKALKGLTTIEEVLRATRE